MNGRICLCAIGLLVSAAATIPGCIAGRLFGGMAQVHEDQKLIDMPPKYPGLENKTVAVLVSTDMATLYEHPDSTAQIASGVAARLGRDVPGVRVLNPQFIAQWQYQTPQWNALPYGELTEQLNVDRVILIDLLEYRLNPPGNRYEWEGVAAANIGIIERDGFDPDLFTDSFDVSVRYPRISGVTRDDAAPERIQFGLNYEFVEKTAWLFHQHLEPKHPDRYRPELDAKK